MESVSIPLVIFLIVISFVSIFIGYRVGAKDRKKLVDQIERVQQAIAKIPDLPEAPTQTVKVAKEAKPPLSAAQQLREAAERNHKAIRDSFESCVVSNISKSVYSFSHHSGVYKNMPEDLILKALRESLKDLRAGNPYLEITTTLSYDKYNQRHYATVNIKGK